MDSKGSIFQPGWRPVLIPYFSHKGEYQFFDEPVGGLSRDTALFQAVVDF